jgi:hypothetical protein
MIRIRFLGFALRHLSFRTPWLSAAVYRLLTCVATVGAVRQYLRLLSGIEFCRNWRDSENELTLNERRSGVDDKKRNNMKNSLLIFMVAGILSSHSVMAEETDEVVYSTEGYCVLSNEGVSEDYLKAYAKKLGAKPSVRVCNSFKEIVAESRPKDWDYPAGRAYPGSVVRLSPSQVALLKSLKKAEK